MEQHKSSTFQWRGISEDTRTAQTDRTNQVALTRMQKGYVPDHTVEVEVVLEKEVIQVAQAFQQ